MKLMKIWLWKKYWKLDEVEVVLGDAAATFKILLFLYKFL